MMPTKQRHKDALKSFGITPVDYFIDGWDQEGNHTGDPIWGTALVRDSKDVAVIESHGCHTDNDALRNKYILKASRDGKVISVHNLKREALAAFARRFLR